MTATRMVWTLAGSPIPDGASGKLLTSRRAVCVMCGHTEDITADAGRATGANFTDQYLYRRPDSDRVCSACLWCCSGKPPATLRMWSIIAAPGVAVPGNHAKCWLDTRPGLCLTNRANPRPVAAILADPPDTPWVVTVAASGQKHVLPYARVNGGDHWTVRMENTDITSTAAEWRTVLGHAAALRAAKHKADAILAGRPDLARITTREDLDLWCTHIAPLTPYVGSPLLGLALWCLTKETIHDHNTHSRSSVGGYGGAAVSTAGLGLF